jgi:hypothetical protein
LAHHLTERIERYKSQVPIYAWWGSPVECFA